MRLSGLRQKRRRELKELWQHQRVLAYYQVLPYLSKTDRKKSIDQLIPDLYDDNMGKVVSLKERYELMKKRLERVGVIVDGKIIQPEKTSGK